MLKHFKINTERDLLVPDLRCFQMDMMGPVNDAIKQNELGKDWSTLPSWAKFGADVYKAQSLLTRTLSGVYFGQNNYNNLNLKYQLKGDTSSVDMWFFSAHNNEQLKAIGDIFVSSVPNADVIVICGAAYFRGKKIKNANCEKFVKEQVEVSKKANRKVIIIAKLMAQRSFGIPEIHNLFLCFDGGQEGTVIQKISRVLSPEDLDKVGNVFSMSFDPNRDDKIDSLLLTTAINLMKKNPGKYKSIKKALGDVLNSVDVLACTDKGAIKFTPDEYIKLSMGRGSVSRAFGNKVDLTKCSSEIIEELANGNADFDKNKKVDKAKTGDTRDTNDKDKKKQISTRSHNNNLKKAREVCITILENSDIIVLGTNSKSVHEGLDKIKKNKSWQKEISQEFGVSFDILDDLFKRNIIEQNWASVLHDF